MAASSLLHRSAASPPLATGYPRIPQPLFPSFARSILDAFDVGDDGTKEYFTSLLASDLVAEADFAVLYDIGTVATIQDRYLTIQHEAARYLIDRPNLRKRDQPANSSSEPRRKKHREKCARKPHIWSNTSENMTTLRRSNRRGQAHLQEPDLTVEVSVDVTDDFATESAPRGSTAIETAVVKSEALLAHSHVTVPGRKRGELELLSGWLGENGSHTHGTRSQTRQMVGIIDADGSISPPKRQRIVTLRGNAPRTSRLQRSQSSHIFSPSSTDDKPDNLALKQVSGLLTPSPSPSKTAKGRSGARRSGPRLSPRHIPPLSAENFGIVQGRLAHDPFRMLVAITFVVLTPGRVAIPVFEKMMARWPTPEALLAAPSQDIISLIHILGLSTKRCETIKKYARIWLECPPSKHMRYGVKNYPRPGDAKDVRLREAFGGEDSSDTDDDDDLDHHRLPSINIEDPEKSPGAMTKSRGFGTAWEIGHMTQGKYFIDSWRIFCRDVLLGRAEDWKGKGRDASFQPEWMRVLPEDKELRACLRWMWMKEGQDWNPLTGERKALSETLRTAINAGRGRYDNTGQLVILEETIDDDV